MLLLLALAVIELEEEQLKKEEVAEEDMVILIFFIEEPATLVRCPKMLFVLWDEHDNGIGSRKLAKEFTTRQEIGLRGNKFKYSNRLIVWKCMEHLIDRGNDAVSTAVRKIHNVYGMQCISTLIQQMRQDKRNGGHASL